jgi:hypothetical protein
MGCRSRERCVFVDNNPHRFSTRRASASLGIDNNLGGLGSGGNVGIRVRWRKARALSGRASPVLVLVKVNPTGQEVT